MKGKLYVTITASVLLLIAVTLTSGVFARDGGDDSNIPGCPRSQGYWANHPEAWPVSTIMLGTQFYTQAELLAILPGGGGDASTILAVQLAAAKLNIAAGVNAAVVSATVQQADALLAQFIGKLPYHVAPSTAIGQSMVSLGGLLDVYNNGHLTPNCVSTPTPTPTFAPTLTPTPGPSPTPTATSPVVTIIVEGPVQAINVNIITIYNVNIQIDANDPVLTTIHIGDFVRVEGNAVSGTNTLVIVAVTVFVVNVDVVITNNNVIVWQDNGKNCQNPPPPWAPAHGWRRRCQNQNITIIINGNDDDQGMGMGMGMGDDD